MTNHAWKSGDLVNSSNMTRPYEAPPPGFLIDYDGFGYSACWWYATREEADQALPSKQAMEDGASRGPGGIYTPKTRITDRSEA